MKPSSTALCLLATLPIALAGCGQNNASNTTVDRTVVEQNMTATEAAPAAANKVSFSLNDGPDVCFREIVKHLGPDAKVASITSFFSAGREIDSGDEEPQGQMTTCTVQYQNPQDPRKLLGTTMDVKTGIFSPPAPVEITVSGDAEAFKLDDYVIPLSKVNAAALKGIMDSQAADMGKVYSKYAWTGVRLEEPGPFSNSSTLRLDLDGRLASNDLQKGGYASISPDGKTITKNFLKP